MRLKILLIAFFFIANVAIADDGNFRGAIQATDISSIGGKFYGDGSSLTNIISGTTWVSGSFTRTANATGTQTLNIGFTPSVIIFAIKDDSI